MQRTGLLIAVGLAVFVVALPLGILLLLMPAEENCGASSGASPSAPPPGTQTAGQVVRYLESQGFSPFGAAGIEGNLQQESGLNPAETGGGVGAVEPRLVCPNVGVGDRARLVAHEHGGPARVPGLRCPFELPAAGLGAQLGDLATGGRHDVRDDV